MVIKFTKENTNYDKQNIFNILSIIPDELIQSLIYSQQDYLVVEGDIHRSQFLAENKMNNYWFKIRGYTSNGFSIPELGAAHIFVCWRKFIYDYKTKNFVIGKCINPRPFKGTDIADISRLKGYWEYTGITYGSMSNINVNNTSFNQNKVLPKKESKALKITNPNTGKVVGGSKRLNQKEIKKLISNIKNKKYISINSIMKISKDIINNRKN